MTEVPVLSPDALAAELHHIHRKLHRTKNTVLLARMAPELPYVDVNDPTGRVRFRVERARSELELRAALTREDDLEPTVVLVDWEPGRLAADLMGRVATGTVQTIARSRRIRVAFSNAQVSEDVLGCRPLVDAIVNEPGFRRAAPPGGLVTLDGAWRAWLLARRIFGQEGESEATLVARFAREPLPAGLADYLAQREELAGRLGAWLEGAVGHVAHAALRLWLAGRGPVAAALAFVLDAARASLGREDYVAGMLAMKLEELSSALGAQARTDARLLVRWADLASMLAAQFEDDPAALLRIIDAADRFLPPHPAITEALGRSDFLRTALEARKRALADALARAAEEPTDAHARAVRDALDALGRHRLREADAGQRELFERARMAARLAGWLLARTRDVPVGVGVHAVALLGERAEDFVQQGAFADFARRIARGGTADALGAAIQRVVERADARRDLDDTEFARGLVEWNSLGRTADRVLPIEAALERFAARFLQGSPARRMLVVLLDGMAWANAVELLESLEEAHYAPLRWKVPGFDRVGVAPVIAALPTITDVSRAALFAGQLVRPGEPLDTSRDPVRLENHKALRALSEKPRLLLKAQLQTSSGDASPEALELVSSTTRVVAVVVNAIDDQLKAGRQTRVAYTLETIKPLRDLLDRATLANRAVLLVADHGHIPGARLTRTSRLQGEEPGGSRWRPVHPGGREIEGEVTLGGSHVWRPAGYERVALLARETDSYGHGTAEGEHGGVAMAEAIAPAILIGSESLAERARNATEADTLDPELEVRPLVRPAWWDLRSAPSAPWAPSLPPTPPPRGRREPEVVSAQIPLAGIAAAPAPAATPKPVARPAKPEASPWEAYFARAHVLKEVGRKMDPRFVAAVDALARDSGVLSVERLGQSLGILPARIEGIVASMAEILNFDGTQVIQYDSTTRLVRLDLSALKEIFG